MAILMIIILMTMVMVTLLTNEIMTMVMFDSGVGGNIDEGSDNDDGDADVHRC